MQNKILNCLFLVGLTVVTRSSVLSAEVTAKDVVYNTVTKVQEEVRNDGGKGAPAELESKLRTIITPVFDFDEMSKRCLGANWKEIGEQDRKEFVSLFSELLAKNYLKQIRLSAAKSSFKVLGSDEEATKATVNTEVDNDKGLIKIDYRLIKRAELNKTEHTWKVYDVIIENIGLISNYRSEFTEIINNEGIKSLNIRLKSKI